VFNYATLHSASVLKITLSSGSSEFSLTPWGAVTLDKLRVLGSLRDTPRFMETEHSLQFSSQLTIYSYPEGDKFRL
jgi:hypothetical protein